MQTSGTNVLIVALLFTASCLRKDCSAAKTAISEEKESETRLEDAEGGSDRSLLEDDDPGTFRERYRRLIPYMTYYVSNNYVNPQAPAYHKSRVISPASVAPIQRRPQGYIGGSRTTGLQQTISAPVQQHFGNDNNKKLTTNRYYVNPPLNRDKFIPSVQYDPTDMDNEEFFTPVVRYNQNLNFEDYQSAFYQRYQTSAQIQPQVTKTADDYRQRFYQQQQQQHQQQQQQRFFTTIGPFATTSTTFAPSYGDLLIRKATPPPPTVRPEYRIAAKKPFKIASDPAYISPRPFRLPEEEIPPAEITTRRPVQANLNHIVKSLQLSNRLPETLNADNIDDSIKTLVEILSLLNGVNPANNGLGGVQRFERPNLAPKRIAAAPKRRPATTKPIIIQDEGPGPYHVNLIDLGNKHLPAKAEYGGGGGESTRLEKPAISSTESTTPSGLSSDGTVTEEPTGKHVATTPVSNQLAEDPEEGENYPPPDGAPSHVQNFPPTSVKYGATRGKPNVDYPAHATIPKTEFNCADQRYKGFFGDPDTGCQVWHYCDLNGGMSSFLCPNGTIFSQVALTCDWWFNVKCESTTQLYVLNERLYKYILPVMPKFPEDFTGPAVDRYLELKFKEMEAKMKEKKLRKQQQQQQQQQHQQQQEKNKNMKNISTNDAE